MALNVFVAVPLAVIAFTGALLSATKFGLARVAVNLSPPNRLRYTRCSIPVTGILNPLPVPPIVPLAADRTSPTA